MRSALEFRKADPTVSFHDVMTAVRSVPPPPGWSWEKDQKLMDKAMAGFGLTNEESARFLALRKAVTSDGYLNLSLQLALHDAVTVLKVTDGAAPEADQVPLARSPDDFCRMCKGTGKLREPGERGVTVVSPCWACGGRGTGR